VPSLWYYRPLRILFPSSSARLCPDCGWKGFIILWRRPDNPSL